MRSEWAVARQTLEWPDSEQQSISTFPPMLQDLGFEIKRSNETDLCSIMGLLVKLSPSSMVSYIGLGVNSVQYC